MPGIVAAAAAPSQLQLFQTNQKTCTSHPAQRGVIGRGVKNTTACLDEQTLFLPQPIFENVTAGQRGVH